jgi:putative Holliday junction resolvase
VYLKEYFAKEPVDLILIGEPLNLDGTATHATPLVAEAVKRLQKEFPHIPLKKVDERFTSKMASRAMVEMDMKKKDRQVKGNIDQIAATIMLQEYLQSIS